MARWMGLTILAPLRWAERTVRPWGCRRLVVDTRTQMPKLFVWEHVVLLAILRCTASSALQRHGY